MSRRLFIGVPVSEGIRKKIKPLLTELNGTGANLNLVSLDNLHFTIKFLGEVELVQIEEIKQKLNILTKDKHKFIIQLSEIGVFPSWQKINVIWIGTSSPELVSLMRDTDKALNYIKKNDFAAEVAHLTVARVKSGKNKEQLKKVIEQRKRQDFGAMIAEYLVLYESELTSKGPMYKELGRFLLQ